MPQTVELLGVPDGIDTPMLELYPEGSDNIVNGAGGDDLTAADNRPGYVSATVAEAITGLHTAHVVDAAGNLVFVDVLDMRGDGNTTRNLKAQVAATFEAAVTVGEFGPAALSQLTGLTFSPTSPIDQTTGLIQLVRGDDYSAADGRALVLTREDGEIWPDVVDVASVALFFKWQNTSTEIAGVYTLDTVTVSVAGAQIPEVINGGIWALQFTHTSGRKITPRVGRLFVLDDGE